MEFIIIMPSIENDKSSTIIVIMEKVSLPWAGAPHWRIYFHCSWGQLSTTCSDATEVAQWAAPNCSRPQSASDHGVRDSSSN